MENGVKITFTVQTKLGKSSFSELDELNVASIRTPLLDLLKVWEHKVMLTAAQQLLAKEIGTDEAEKVELSIQETE